MLSVKTLNGFGKGFLENICYKNNIWKDVSTHYWGQFISNIFIADVAGHMIFLA